MTLRTYLISLLIICSIPSFGRHILGGEMTYRCLGEDLYEFELTMYRDCQSNGAPFDHIINLAFYECGEEIACIDLTQMNVNEVLNNQEMPLEVMNVENIDISESIDCPLDLVPCIERGVYRTAPLNITLPKSNNTYYIAYQRCCRNELLKNLLNAGISGATYFAEIPPTAQNLCNSSPVFNTLPPFVLCTNRINEVDLSATDLDGDSLVYTLTTPIAGGGPQLGPEEYQTCIGAVPIPTCPPPYEKLSFTAGFSSDNQINTSRGGGSKFELDAHTGLLTGIPTAQGNFAVGIAVSEYRNGVFLGTTRRDFQVSVVAGSTVSTESLLAQINTFQVAPNPSDKDLHLTIDLANKKPLRIVLQNLVGQAVFKETYNSSTIATNISVQDLSAGIYFLSLHLEGQVLSKKVVIR